MWACVLLTAALAAPKLVSGDEAANAQSRIRSIYERTVGHLDNLLDTLVEEAPPLTAVDVEWQGWAIAVAKDTRDLREDLGKLPAVTARLLRIFNEQSTHLTQQKSKLEGRAKDARRRRAEKKAAVKLLEDRIRILQGQADAQQTRVRQQEATVLHLEEEHKLRDECAWIFCLDEFFNWLTGREEEAREARDAGRRRLREMVAKRDAAQANLNRRRKALAAARSASGDSQLDRVSRALSSVNERMKNAAAIAEDAREAKAFLDAILSRGKTLAEVLRRVLLDPEGLLGPLQDMGKRLHSTRADRLAHIDKSRLRAIRRNLDAFATAVPNYPLIIQVTQG